MKPLVPFVRSLRVGVVGCVLPSLLSCAGGFSSTTPSVPPPTPSTLAFDSSTNQTGGRPQYSAEDFFQSTSLRAVSFSHDSTRVLLSSDATGIFNSYSQSVTGGAPIALTHSTGDAAWAGRYFPKDDRFLYMADNGGDENQHAYVGLPDGTIKDLTPGDRLKAIFMGFLANDETFFIATNERDPKNFDLYGYSTQQYTRHMVYKNTTGLTLGNVSPNGRWVSLGKVVDNRDSDLFLVEVGTTNELRAITPHEGKANHQSLTFTADSKQLVYRTDAHSDFHQAWTYDLESQAHAPLIQAEWDVMNVKFSKHGRLRASTINQDASSPWWKG